MKLSIVEVFSKVSAAHRKALAPAAAPIVIALFPDREWLMRHAQSTM